MGFAGMARSRTRWRTSSSCCASARGGLERDAIDVLLECLDALAAAVEAIEADGDEDLDPPPLIERLHGLVRARTRRAGARTRRHRPPARRRGAEHRRRPRACVHVVRRLDDDVLMPAVRAYMVLAALAEHGEIARLRAAPDDVEQLRRPARSRPGSPPSTSEAAVTATVVAPSPTSTGVGRSARSPPREAVRAPTPAAGGRAAPDRRRARGRGAPRPSRPPPAPDAAPAEPQAAAAKTASAARTVRVDAERLDQLMHFMGELVLHRTRSRRSPRGSTCPGLQQAMQELTRTSQALQAMVMQVRMIPVEAVFLRFPRLVRDLSTKLGKQVELELVGKDTELDRTVVDALGDPLVHLVRNSLDHGLEPPEERVAAGKPATGTLEISARHAGGNVVIEVRDDGRGIDPAGGRRARPSSAG